MRFFASIASTCSPIVDVNVRACVLDAGAVDIDVLPAVLQHGRVGIAVILKRGAAQLPEHG